MIIWYLTLFRSFQADKDISNEAKLVLDQSEYALLDGKWYRNILVSPKEYVKTFDLQYQWNIVKITKLLTFKMILKLFSPCWYQINWKHLKYSFNQYMYGWCHRVKFKHTSNLTHGGHCFFKSNKPSQVCAASLLGLWCRMPTRPPKSLPYSWTILQVGGEWITCFIPLQWEYFLYIGMCKLLICRNISKEILLNSSALIGCRCAKISQTADRLILPSEFKVRLRDFIEGYFITDFILKVHLFQLINASNVVIHRF